MLFKQYPFIGKTREELLKNIKTRKLTFNKVSKISDNAKNLINKMLEIDPNKRIKFKDIWQHPFINKNPEKTDEMLMNSMMISKKY